MARIIGYHHLSLTVTDRDRSVEWYRDVLGFEIHSEVEGAGFRRTRLRVPGGDTVLTLTQHDAGSGDRFDERRTGLDHIAFRVASVDDVHEFKRRFEQLGADHSEIRTTATGDGAAVTLRDPDNIQLEVFATPA